MKLFSRKRRKTQLTRQQRTRTRRMSVESLENRRVLAANFVTINIAGDTLNLTGDTNANQVEIWQDSRRGFDPSESFTIKAKDGSDTMFIFAGDVVDSPYKTPISTAFHNINVNFGQGGADVVEFVGLNQTATDKSFLDGTLTVTTDGDAVVSLQNLELDSLFVSHQDDDDVGTTMLNNVVVTDDTKVVDGARTFFSTHIESGGGGSDISIVDSHLKGGLSISNDGLVVAGVHVPNATGAADIIKISNTDIGELLVMTPQNVLEIYNGDGGSRTTMERDNATDPSRIRGNVVIHNADGFDEVNFSAINIWGSSEIENGDGDILHGSSTMIHRGSVIGSDLLAGGRLKVNNGDGDDRLTIEESRLPSGIEVNNGNDHDTNTIVIGKAGDVASPATRTIVGGNTLAGNVIQFKNGSGNERLNFVNTDFRGLVDLGLGAGDDVVNMTDVVVDGTLNIGNTDFRPAFVDALFTALGIAGADDGNAGNGNDRVTLEDVMVTAGTFMNLGQGQDRVELIDNIDFGPRAEIRGGNNSGDTLDRSQLSSVMLNVDFNGFLDHIN